MFKNSPIKDHNEGVYFPPTEVHNFYQEVFITDMWWEIDQAKEEKDIYKREMLENRDVLTKL